MLHNEPFNDICWISNSICAQLNCDLCNAILFIMMKCHVVILECQVVIGYDLYNITCNINEVPDSSFITKCHVVIRECQVVISYNLYNVTHNIDGVPGSLFIVECHVVILECQVV